VRARKRFLWAGVILLAVGGYSAPLAAEVAAVGRIAAVTVFPDRALVTREVPVALPAGDVTVMVGGLPAGVLADSLRVEGKADVPLVVGSLESRRVFAEELVGERERELNQQLQGLRDDQRRWADKALALGHQLAFIQALGQKMPERFDVDTVLGRVEPGSWKEAWAAIGNGAAETYGAIQEAELRQRELGEKIQKVQQELSQIATGRREELQARINVTAERAGKATLRLAYQVRGASWWPTYDARLAAEEGTLRLDQLAQVRQNTGEEWAGVALTLSTARPSQGAQVPELQPWFLDFLQVRPLARAKAVMSEGRMMNMAADSAAGAPPAPQEMAVGRVEAEVTAGEFAAEYRIPGPATVPADNQPHQFAVGEHALQARLAVRTVPKVAPVGYLLAKATYEGEAALLPGQVSLFRGDAFIGKVALPLIRPGEEVDLSFGADDRVRVEYAFDTGKRSQKGIFEKRRREERRYRVEVTNHHGRPVEITVLDQVPVPQDERIKVELLEDTTPPTERDPDGVRGVLAWRRTYAPQEKVLTLFGYAVSYPEGETVPGF